MTRTEYVAWAKQRALELLDAEDGHSEFQRMTLAYASMVSDLGNEGIACSDFTHLGMMMLANLDVTPTLMREHINGFQ